MQLCSCAVQHENQQTCGCWALKGAYLKLRQGTASESMNEIQKLGEKEQKISYNLTFLSRDRVILFKTELHKTNLNFIPVSNSGYEKI